MTRRRWCLAALGVVSLSVAGPAAAQNTTDEIAPAIDAILGALRLPQVVSDARDAGVADSTLTDLVDRFRDTELSAAEAEDLLDQEMEVVRAGGPVDNFGAFVQGRLEAGLRGRELAAAIRAEHRSRGIGVPERRPDRGMGRRGGPGRGGAEGSRGRGAEGRSGNGRGRDGRGGRG